MTRIRNIFNNGVKDGGKLGKVEVNSYNVFPSVKYAKAPWATSTAYTVGEVVVSSSVVYTANTAHTSDGTAFATDLALGYWDATPNAGTLTRAELNKYDFFKIDQVNAATNEFDLPDIAEVGDSFVLYAVNPFEVRTATDSDEINGAASFGFVTVAKSTYYCTRVPESSSAKEWRVLAIAEDGSVTTVAVTIAP
jgi:hypothetical protein